jgi:D-sedoheptulose 7-phosphate isomerase
MMIREQLLANLTKQYPVIQDAVPSIREFCDKLIAVFNQGGRLFIAGNGGSMADAQHIAAELIKSFECGRKLSQAQRKLLLELPDGAGIANQLENGLPVFVLGLNHSLTTAILNDFEEAHLEFAQELWVLGTKNDLLLGISTKGEAKNILYAMSVARAKGMSVTAFTGKSPNPMSERADISLCLPDATTAVIQEMQQIVYHTICRIIEAHYFKNNT